MEKVQPTIKTRIYINEDGNIIVTELWKELWKELKEKLTREKE